MSPYIEQFNELVMRMGTHESQDVLAARYAARLKATIKVDMAACWVLIAADAYHYAKEHEDKYLRRATSRDTATLEHSASHVPLPRSNPDKGT